MCLPDGCYFIIGLPLDEEGQGRTGGEGRKGRRGEGRRDREEGSE